MAAAGSFYDSERPYMAVKAFHDRYALQPDDTTVRAALERNTRELIGVLQQDGMCQRPEYTGSSYDGVKVSKTPTDPDHEYDVMMIMPGGNTLKASQLPNEPGYVTLMQRPNQVPLRLGGTPMGLDGAGNILSKGIGRRFMSKFQTIVNSSEEKKAKWLLRAHGPAVQIDVYEDRIGGTKLYSVDMVPAFEVDGKLYVAKEIPGKKMAEASWRQSFSLREKELMRAVDGKDNGCRKQVLRVLKVMKNKDTTLQGLTSFHFKTEWLKVVCDKDCVDDDPASNEIQGKWSYNKLGQRTIDVLRKLQADLTAGTMPHYFDPSVNLVASIPQITITNIRDRVARLVSSEAEFTKLIKVDSAVDKV